jgi:hypothetical protein
MHQFFSTSLLPLNYATYYKTLVKHSRRRSINHPDKIVSEAVRLLKSPNWANMAAGLAVLTGRRVAEILSTAKFKKRSQFSILFTGALKRRGEPVELTFEIPTLTTADHIITALSRLRAELPEAVHMSPSDINKKYESAVANVCDRTFAQLVPAREGQGNLYTHLFRAVYATIATFWYCPPSVNETEFKAAIQGHYSIRETQDDHLQRSLAASRHYSDYEISDQEVARYHGKRKGIKLGLAGVEPIEQFRQALAPKPQKQRREDASYRMWKEDKQRLQLHLEQFEGTQQERFHALLNQLEALQNQAVQSEPEPSITALENIPMQSRPELDEIAIATPQDSKIDDLLQAISHLVEVQTALIQAQAQSTKSADPRIALNTDHEQPEVAPRQRVSLSETSNRLNQAIDAIIQYNNQPSRKHQEKWAIGISSLKAFVKNQEAIVAVVGGKNRKGELITGTRQQEIQLHHQQHQIEPDKHNYLHRGKTKIIDIFTLPV